MFKYSLVANDYKESLIKTNILKEKLQNLKAIEDNKDPEYVFVIGGDGTFINAINKFQNILHYVIFVPFNTGTIGFYTNHNTSFCQEQIIKTIEQKNFNFIEYDLLDVEFDNKHIYGVNELKVVNENKAIFTNVHIDGDFFERFHGTGLAFSTANGSTGYIKATGGSVIFDNSGIWQMQEIFPVSTNKYRTINSPIIMSKEHEILLTDEVNRQSLIIDTFAYAVKEPFVRVKLADFKIKVLVLKEYFMSKAEILRSIFIKDKDN